MSTEPKIADYTTRSDYQRNYSKTHREAINSRKRLWRQERKLLCAAAHTIEQKYRETDETN